MARMDATVVRVRIGLIAATLLAPAASGRADDAPTAGRAVPSPAATKPAEPPAPPLRPATDAEARPLVEALAAASRGKPADALRALSALAGLEHAEFIRPLARLIPSEDEEVALAAATCLERRKPTGSDPKSAAKELDRVVRDLWKTGFQHPVNGRRPIVRGAVVRVIGAWGMTLDAKQFDDVRSVWARELGTPDPKRAAAFLHVIAYVEATKDKRLCRLLAEQIDQPTAENVHDAANPSAAYWEARWRLWDRIRDPAIAALTALTGQVFTATADAKKWFAANERAFGFAW